MKLQLISDLHSETFSDRASVRGYCQGLLSEADVLCVAGDLGVLGPPRYFELAAAALDVFCGCYPQVLYVAGNHEYYGSDFSFVGQRMHQLRERFGPGRLVTAEDGIVMPVKAVKGQQILGCTLWFPHRSGNAGPWMGMADARLIEGGRPRRSLMMAEERGEMALGFLMRNVGEGDVVVSHHLPHEALISPAFEDDSLNRFYLHEGAQGVIRKRHPALWFCGHTHSSFDVRVGKGVEKVSTPWGEHGISGGTRIVCNPVGYHRPGGRNRAFDPRLLIEI